MAGASSPRNPHLPDEPQDENLGDESVIPTPVAPLTSKSVPQEKARRTEPSETLASGPSRTPPSRLQARTPPNLPPSGESFSELGQIALIVLAIAFLIATTAVGTYMLMAKGGEPTPTSPPVVQPAPVTASGPLSGLEEVHRLQQELHRKTEELAQLQRINGNQSDQVNTQNACLTEDVQSMERELRAQASALEQARTAQRNAEETRLRAELRLADAERRAKESAELALKARRELLTEKAKVKAGVLPPEQLASAFAPSGPVISQQRVPLLDADGVPLNPDRTSPERGEGGPQLAIAARGEGPASPAKGGNGPSEAMKKSLLVEVERAIQLIESDQIEPLIDEFFPTESVRSLRKDGSLEAAAASLKESGVAIPNLLSRLEQCRTGLIEGNDSEVQFVPNLTGDQSPNSTAQIEGYGDDFLQVLRKGGAALKAGQYEEFVTRVFPIAEVLELQRTGQLEAIAQQFRSNPALVVAMGADFEAMLQAEPEPKDGAIRLGLSGQSDDEGIREVRWQLVGGSWRFFDQTTEAKERIQQVERDAGYVRAILKFERVRDHWRLTELPK